MSNFPARAASKPRFALLFVFVLLAVIAALAFLGGSRAAAASAGGVGPDATPSGGSEGSGGGRYDRYDRIWEEVPASQKRWARQTAECESGGDPKAIGGGGAYRGAFQFLKSTWRASPKSPGGDPIDYDYKTQAVVAVMLKRQAGSSPWPVCG